MGALIKSVSFSFFERNLRHQWQLGIARAQIPPEHPILLLDFLLESSLEKSLPRVGKVGEIKF